jgi:hypothetical protein
VTGSVDVDSLPPTQYLIMDTLAARYRTGEHLWTFPTMPGIVRATHDLARAGLVGMKSGIGPKTIQVWLTDAGETAVLRDGWENPATEARRLLVAQLRRSTNHVDGRALLWPHELGPEPSWFAGQAILADPVLSARYGLHEETMTP